MSLLAKRYSWASSPLIIAAPMKVIGGPKLAVSVSKAGGFGFIGPGAKSSDAVQRLGQAKDLINESDSPQLKLAYQTTNLLPVGIGFQTWADDLSVATQAVQTYRPQAVWLFAPRNGQTELDLWTTSVRKASKGTEVWIQVVSVKDAIECCKSEHSPDVLVVQGTDAGGHGAVTGAGIISILPEVSDAVSREFSASKSKERDAPLLVATGGIADGRGVAAGLVLGASGVAMGTRFLASDEAQLAAGYRQAVLDASDGGQNTGRTTLYNEVRGTVGWPTIYNARGILNKTYYDHLAGLSTSENKQKYAEALKAGDAGWGQSGRLTAYAGTAVGLIHESLPAGQVVESVRNQAIEILNKKWY